MNDKILIVDDKANIRMVLRGILESSGYVITEADNGISALEEIEEDIPDAVLTDLKMDEMDGIELTKKNKKQISFAAGYSNDSLRFNIKRC